VNNNKSMTTLNFTLTGYQTLDRIYAGTRTLVYRGTRLCDKRPVAIKVLRSEYPSFTELVQFRNQYTIAKNLNLPGIIETYSLEAYQNSYALIMEDFGGISLQAWTEQGEILPNLRDFLQMAIDISNTLDILCRHRIIHKDIKPPNILINPQTRQVKLIDFSIASLLPRETQTLMNPNVIEGTLGYLSPEQTGRMNRGIDYRTDFYSLGVTFYELLAGQLPFQSNDAMELVHSHIAKQPPSLHEVNPQIPPVLSEIVSKLMAKNAEDRYQSALGLKFDLEFCLQQLEESGQIEGFEIAQRDLCDRFSIPEKLYGRETEVETLLEAFERVSSGTTEMTLVAGFSGIGKTVVVNEVHKPIVRQRGYFIKGKFDQFNRNIPFSAFVQAFRDLMGQLLSESDEKLENWQTQILQALGDNGQVIIEVIPELEKIIGQQPPATELSGTAAQNRFNLLFQNFIKVFAKPEHPLVMFLDDLQWADSASLQLMQLLMSESGIGYLLVIGAYRDNEVFAAHPLMLTLDTVVKAGATVNTITLESLSTESLNDLVADTLNCVPALARPLTDLVAQKTQGNPFFATQFLKALHQDGLITFDLQAGHWQCDIVRVREAALTDDVVEFMALQLQKLPGCTQDKLKIAACIGNSFDLETLATVTEESPIEIATNLWIALQEGLIFPTNEVYKFYVGRATEDAVLTSEIVSYKFLHDRVQQAAYSLIPDQQKQITHLKIGQLLLSHIPVGEQDENLFEIVNQLNIGKSLIVSTVKQIELAQLNLKAGYKARAATAYVAALEYFTTSIDLLTDNGWQTQYELTLELYTAATEAAYLSGNFERMAGLSTISLEHAKTLLDRVNVYQVEIQAAQAQAKPSEAIQIALQILQQLGVTFPAQPNGEDIGQALGETLSILAGRQPLDLIDLPQMTDADQLAIMGLLAGVTASAYVVAPTLLPLIMLEQVKRSLEYGNSLFSPDGYCGYGLILCGVVGDIESGYQFGQLALLLLEKLDTKKLKARIYGQVNCCISHWKEPLSNTLPFFREGYQSGLETGDLEWGGICAVLYLMHAWFAGKELSDLSREGAVICTHFAQLRQKTMSKLGAIFQQAILNLLGNTTEAWRFTGETFNEEEDMPIFLESGNQTARCYFYVSKLVLCYLFGQFEEAIASASTLEKYLGAATGMSLIPVFHTYDSLAHLAIYSQVSEAEQQGILQRVTAHQEKVEHWADCAPANQLHKFYLVGAEQHRVLGNKLEAIEHYDRAILLAKDNKYLQEEALANELAAKFYLDWGKEKVAQAYMQDAYYCYARWGAKAKIDDLEKRYPQLLAPILQAKQNRSALSETSVETIKKKSILHETFQKTYSSSSSISEALDFGAILKASQALSSEIKLEKLLAALMSVVIKNAGAKKAVLLLLKDGNLAIEAVASLKEDVISISVPLSASAAVPAGLVNYVKRTLKTLVLDNAAAQNDFMTDPYLMEEKPKSVLCAPILHQGKFIGLLYLENNLTIGAFTEDRTEVIQLLCAQAAISLENARLYQQSQAYAQELERSIKDLQQAQLQLVQSEKMSALGNLVAGVAHEINNPVGFINGNIEEATTTIKDVIDHLKLYQEKLPNPGDEIEQDAEDIDLEYALEDLPKMLSSMKVGCDRIRGISTSLRTFSRADKDYKVPFNIHEGIESTILILKHRLKANEHRPAIEVVTDYGNLPKIECFPGQLNQVFMNLLANAIDALEESNQGRSFEALKANPHSITVRTSQSDDRHIKIQIADNGAGMTEAVKQQIFDHLFTTKAVGKGTGLGLAIARQIVVETHGGTINVNSTLGGGSEFEIVLPITE